MLPWRRASMCNRDNSWGMKALRRGRVTSGIQITGTAKSIHQSLSISSQKGKAEWQLGEKRVVKMRKQTTEGTTVIRKQDAQPPVWAGQSEFKHCLTQIQWWATTGKKHYRASTHSCDPGQVNAGGWGALIGEQVAVIGGPCELPKDYDRVV